MKPVSAPGNAARIRKGMLRGTLLAAILLIAATLAPLPAQAHITGVFLYFLKDVSGQAGQSSLDILAAQLKATNARIAALQPQVAAARKAYQAQARPAAERLRFYHLYAGEGLAAVLFGGHDLVDALANAQMIQRMVAHDLAGLQQTATAYRQLQQKETALLGYRDLLSAMTEAQHRYHLALDGKDPQDQELALYNVSESWEEIRSGPLDQWIRWSEAQLRQVRRAAVPVGRPDSVWQTAFTAGGSAGPSATAFDPAAAVVPPTPPAGLAGRPGYYVGEAALNRLIGGQHTGIAGVENVRLYLRADHIFIVAHFKVPLGERQVILVGQLQRSGNSVIRYHTEYALVDGHLIPNTDPQMQEVVNDGRLLRIDGRRLQSGSQRLQYEQDNGGVWLYAN